MTIFVITLVRNHCFRQVTISRWMSGVCGWGKTLDEAYDTLCAERERKEDMHDADHAAHRPA